MYTSTVCHPETAPASLEFSTRFSNNFTLPTYKLVHELRNSLMTYVTRNLFITKAVDANFITVHVRHCRLNNGM